MNIILYYNQKVNKTTIIYSQNIIHIRRPFVKENSKNFDIENGEKAVSLESFISIANGLGVSADVLLGSVLTNGYQVKTSMLCERINTLSSKKREMVQDLLEILLRDKD